MIIIIIPVIIIIIITILCSTPTFFPKGCLGRLQVKTCRHCKIGKKFQWYWSRSFSIQAMASCKMKIQEISAEEIRQNLRWYGTYLSWRIFKQQLKLFFSWGIFNKPRVWKIKQFLSYWLDKALLTVHRLNDKDTARSKLSWTQTQGTTGSCFMAHDPWAILLHSQM